MGREHEGVQVTMRVCGCGECNAYNLHDSGRILRVESETDDDF